MTKGGAIEELWTAPTFWVRGVRVDWPFTGIAIEVLQSWRREHLRFALLAPITVHTVHCASTYD